MTQTLFELLDLTPFADSDLAWHIRISEGFPAGTFKALARSLKMPEKHLVELFAPDRRLSKVKPLSHSDSNLLHRVAQAFRELTAQRGKSAADAATWLKQPHAGLKGRVPLELLTTYHGSNYVFTAIERA